MKYVYLTVDLEEWYELDYLKNYKLDQSVEVIPEIIDFLDLLDQFQIKATFFVLATALKKNTDIVKEINRRGHAIGCHGLDHELLYNKGTNQFINEVVKAKKDIEKSVDCEVNGYRASCFSMERDKLDALFHAGFQYDSSFIKFEQHTLYRNLDLKGFEQKDALVYINDGFIEYEIPTLKIGKICLPISGGGYLRLFPYWLIFIFLKIYARQQDNFLLYLHPFELTTVKLPFSKEVSWKKRFRASVGRKGNMKKLKRVLRLLASMGAEFRTLDQDKKERVKQWKKAS
jgi:polysaccharide deacetylase family protein (PEP-CTERM system associated)